MFDLENESGRVKSRFLQELAGALFGDAAGVEKCRVIMSVKLHWKGYVFPT
jgi:hypothetical protein